jgi:hypothetical protein
MPRVGFERMTPVFKQAKTIYALDRAATVIGCSQYTNILISSVYRGCNVLLNYELLSSNPGLCMTHKLITST